MTDRRTFATSRAGYLVVALVFLTAAVNGQSPRPRPRPMPAPARPAPVPAPARTGTFVVETDLACELSVDGQSKGVLETGRVITVDVAPGEHLARCGATADTEVV